jgi:hypothetical protein
MTIGITVTGCLLIVALTATWFSPWRPYLLRVRSAFDRFRFMCRVEQLTDESLPSGEDQFFRVQIIGRIPTTGDNIDTDVRLRIQDITEGRLHPQQVLSADEQFRDGRDAEFYCIKPNGIVPEKNAVLARWTIVAQFPCHILRFSHRGRRKVLFCVTVCETETGRELVTAYKRAEYVYFSDGYREVHTRRRDVLQSYIELAVFSLGSAPVFSDDVKSLWTEWILKKSDSFMSSAEVQRMMDSVEANASELTIEDPSEVLLAYGQSTDAFLALELALRTASAGRTVTAEMFQRISHIAEALRIKRDRFLTMAQKIVLSSGCHVEQSSCLLGISPEMDQESFRKRLNEEYRKWNGRVTHPDEQVRSQADRILTLIAEIRTQRLQSCS